MERKVMISPIAGQWYSGHAGSLRSEIEELRSGKKLTRRQRVCAVVVPHAGYRYSGAIAVDVYQRLDHYQYERVVVLGPSHYCDLKNKISIPDATHYETPLGLIQADVAYIKKLRNLPFITSRPETHAREHSDQIQLPLIQACLSPALPVVCMVCGQFDASQIVETAAALRELMDDKTLLVVSSDFTHYGANFGFVPFNKDVQRNIEMLDAGIFDLFVNKDLEGFMERLNQTGATVCGRDPLSLLLAMLPEDADVERTAYQTSGQMLSDNRHSVSYLGALVTGRWSAAARPASVPAADQPLSKEAGSALLALARKTIMRALATGQKNVGFLADMPDQREMEMVAHRGGFVTLTIRGSLRGCIGEIFPSRAIWKVIREQAYNAAYQDPRFVPLTSVEADELEIEISVLSQPRAVSGPEKIEIGRHGVVLNKHGLSAVFLPQVATDQGWSREETLAHLAVKAGLPPDAWQEGATFLVFEAQIFTES
ncbi:MAG: AmmeMemoRadiSam system protein B [Kiritimatiellae bacterium]|nr:AmmeMemoRadiSam system protein B [Kiritimatiellia bacterium]